MVSLQLQRDYDDAVETRHDASAVEEAKVLRLSGSESFAMELDFVLGLNAAKDGNMFMSPYFSRGMLVQAPYLRQHIIVDPP